MQPQHSPKLKIAGDEVILTPPLSLVSFDLLRMIKSQSDNVIDYLRELDSRGLPLAAEGKIVVARANWRQGYYVFLGFSGDSHKEILQAGVQKSKLRGFEMTVCGGAFFKIDWSKQQSNIYGSSVTLNADIDSALIPWLECEINSLAGFAKAEPLGLESRDFILNSASGPLKANLTTNPKAGGDIAALVCPGLAVGMDGKFALDMMQRLFRLPNVKHCLRFNFSGHDNNQFNPDISGFTFSKALDDYKAAIHNLRQRTDGKVIAVCSSTGTQPAVLAACEKTDVGADLIVARAPVLDCFQSVLQSIPATVLEHWKTNGKFQFPVGGDPVTFSAEFISDVESWSKNFDLSQLRTPLVLVHGGEDRIVPLPLVEKMLSAAPQDLVQLNIIENAAHDFSADADGHHIGIMLEAISKLD